MPNRVLRAVGYRRVSMREQVDGHSLDAQANHIQTYVASQGWRLVELYTDAGLSAKKGSARPAFDRMLADARNGQFDVIVADKIDRFARHLGTLLVALDQLNSANVSFVSVQEHLDLTTPWGKLMLTVLGILAEIYIDNLRQETRKGKVQRARDGLWNGSIPLGYCNGLCSRCTDPNGANYCPEFGKADKSDGKHLILHPIEQVAVKLAFEWYLSTPLSDGRLARKLNAYQHLLLDGTPIALRTKGMPGRYPPGPFSKDAVRDLLQRRFYTGQIAYRGTDEHGQRRRRNEVAETFKGQQPILVDLATFEQAQEIRKTLYCSPRIKFNKPARIYPLSGILRCAQCGKPLRSLSSSGRRYYRDSTRIDHSGPCDQPSLLAEQIEDEVASFLTQIALPEDWPASADEWLGQYTAEDSQRALQRWERAKELYLAGEISKEQYEAEAKVFEANENFLTKTMYNATIALGNWIRGFAEEWAKALPYEKRKLLRVAIAAAFVWDNQLVAVQPTPALYPLVMRSSDGSHCNCGDDGH